VPERQPPPKKKTMAGESFRVGRAEEVEIQFRIADRLVGFDAASFHPRRISGLRLGLLADRL
jgi:hypothetical protein